MVKCVEKKKARECPSHIIKRQKKIHDTFIRERNFFSAMVI